MNNILRGGMASLGQGPVRRESHRIAVKSQGNGVHENLAQHLPYSTSD
jgi:hypothetical protein